QLAPDLVGRAESVGGVPVLASVGSPTHGPSPSAGATGRSGLVISYTSVKLQWGRRRAQGACCPGPCRGRRAAVGFRGQDRSRPDAERQCGPPSAAVEGGRTVLAAGLDALVDVGGGHGDGLG